MARAVLVERTLWSAPTLIGRGAFREWTPFGKSRTSVPRSATFGRRHIASCRVSARTAIGSASPSAAPPGLTVFAIAVLAPTRSVALSRSGALKYQTASRRSLIARRLARTKRSHVQRSTTSARSMVPGSARVRRPKGVRARRTSPAALVDLRPGGARTKFSGSRGACQRPIPAPLFVRRRRRFASSSITTSSERYSAKPSVASTWAHLAHAVATPRGAKVACRTRASLRRKHRPFAPAGRMKTSATWKIGTPMVRRPASVRFASQKVVRALAAATPWSAQTCWTIRGVLACRSVRWTAKQGAQDRALRPRNPEW
mmetsp:Transcript_114708/g.324225  ORF Transcript_114708/g.324225 Transcript_114708/m.324225 type:complete len:315 (-) Transcript_114708:961-1905(-)